MATVENPGTEAVSICRTVSSIEDRAAQRRNAKICITSSLNILQSVCVKGDSLEARGGGRNVQELEAKYPEFMKDLVKIVPLPTSHTGKLNNAWCWVWYSDRYCLQKNLPSTNLAAVIPSNKSSKPDPKGWSYFQVT